MQTTMRSGQIRKALEDHILSEDIEAGSRLDEQALARQFNVSRTPVREALNQLASAGLVELIPNRGAFVRQVSIAELVQMFEVMAELEAMAGRLAARRADGAVRVRLEAALSACADAARRGNSDNYYILNSDFHEAIYQASGNAFLAEEAWRLHQRLSAYRRVQLQVPKRVEHSLAEHREIVRAILDGDAARAERALRDHIIIQGERFTDFIAQIARRQATK